MSSFRNRTRNAVIGTALAAGIMLGVSGCNFKPTEIFRDNTIPAISQSMPAPESDNTGGLKYDEPIKQVASQVVFNLADLTQDELQVFGEVLQGNQVTMTALQQDYLKTETGWQFTGYVSITGHNIYANEKQFMIFSGDEVLTTADKAGIDLKADTCSFYNAAGMAKLFNRSALLREDGSRVMLTQQELADDYVDCDTVLMDGVKISGKTKASVAGS